ncbi:MAG: HYR domain-containing protein [Planctomycetota bacterium]
MSDYVGETTDWKNYGVPLEPVKNYTTLKRLLPDDSGWELSTARGINSAGDIIGRGVQQIAGSPFPRWYLLYGDVPVEPKKPVNDTEPPHIFVPPDQIEFTNNPDGAMCYYPTPLVTDNISRHPRLNFSQSPGSLFPVGTTPVIITATDEAGNSSTASFKMEVIYLQLNIENVPVEEKLVPGAVIGVKTRSLLRLDGVMPPELATTARAQLEQVGTGRARVWAADLGDEANAVEVLAAHDNFSVNLTSNFIPGAPPKVFYIEGVETGAMDLHFVCFIGNRLISDILKVNVIKIEFVTKNSDGEMTPLSEFFANCTPIPTISANVTNTNFSNGTVTLLISGIVKDALSDVVEDAENQVNSVDVLLDDGTVLKTIALQNSTQPELPWKPYKFEASYSTIVSFYASAPGSYAITLKTSPNAAGLTGTATVKTIIEGDDTRFAATMNLVLPDNFRPDVMNSIVFYLGDRAPQVDDPVLIETAVGTSEFQGSLGWAAITATVKNFTGLTTNTDVMTVEYTLISPDGSTSKLEVPMNETAAISNRFTYSRVAFLMGPNKAIIGKDHVADAISITLVGDFALNQADTISFGTGDGMALVEQVQLLETTATSQIFTGSVTSGSVQVIVQQFAGLTSDPDAMTVEIQFSYLDGAKTARVIMLNETGAETNTFVYKETQTSFVGFEGDAGTLSRNFLPVMLRVTAQTGLFANKRFFTATVFGKKYEMKKVDVGDGTGITYYAKDANDEIAIFVPTATAMTESDSYQDAGAQGADNVRSVANQLWRAGVTWEETGQDQPPPMRGEVTASKMSGLFVGGNKKEHWINPNPKNEVFTDAQFKQKVKDKASEILSTYDTWNETKIAIAQETLEGLIGDKRTAHVYKSQEILLTEIKLRQATVDAATAFAKAKVRFTIEDYNAGGLNKLLKCDDEFWTKKIFKTSKVGSLQLNQDIVAGRPSKYQGRFVKALDSIFDLNGTAYDMDCSMAIGTIWLRAHVMAAIKEWKMDQTLLKDQDTIDAMFCVHQEGANKKLAEVCIIQMPGWAEGKTVNLEMKVRGRRYAMDIDYARLLLPGDRFFIDSDNYIYTGNDGYVCHMPHGTVSGKVSNLPQWKTKSGEAEPKFNTRSSFDIPDAEQFSKKVNP